jgi:hypothetical protein
MVAHCAAFMTSVLAAAEPFAAPWLLPRCYQTIPHQEDLRGPALAAFSKLLGGMAAPESV